MSRLFKHLFARPASGLFPADSLARIGQAIHAGEERHGGEVCFAVESDLPIGAVWRNVSARERACEVFSHLGVWNTRANNGVLVYLLLADHRIEIVADRGIDALVSAEQWRGVCQLMEERLAAGEAEQGVIAGVEAIADLLALHFPRTPDDGDTNELPNLPRILR